MKLLIVIGLVTVSFTGSANDMFKFAAVNNDVIQCAAHYDVKKEKTSDELAAAAKLMQLVVNEYGLDKTHVLLSKEIGKINKITTEERKALEDKCGWVVIQSKRG